MSAEHSEFAACMAQVGELIEAFEGGAAPDAVEPARELVRAVLDLHRLGLRELLDTVRGAPMLGGDELVRALCARPNLASLFLLHELHPDSLSERIAQVVAQANLAAAGAARAELVVGAGQAWTVRVEATDAPAALSLRRVLERLVSERAPDAELAIEGGELPARDGGLIPVTRLYARGRESGA